MQIVLGRPLDEALRTLAEGETPPRVLYTAAPVRSGHAREEGTFRIIAVRENEWIAARFLDAVPKENEET